MVVNASGALNGKMVKLPLPAVPATPASPSSLPAVNELPVFQCAVANALAQGTLTYFQNADAVIDVVKNTQGYYLKVNYQVNGQPSNLPEVTIQNVAMIKNIRYPIYTVFSTSSNQMGGFMIQFNTQTGEAQFEPYAKDATLPITGGTILCVAK